MASKVRARAPRPRNRQLEALTAEAVNANIRISDACADTCTLFCADFSGLSALVNLTTLNLSGTKIREF